MIRIARRSGLALFAAAAALAGCGSKDKQAGPGGPTPTGPAAGSGRAAAPPTTTERLRTTPTPAVPGETPLDPVPAGPLVTVDGAALSVDGKPLARLEHGRVLADDLEPGGRLIKALVGWARDRAGGAGPGPAVAVAVPPSTRAEVLLQVTSSLAAADPGPVAVVVRTPDGVGTLALRPATSPADDDPPPAGLLLELTPSASTIWWWKGTADSRIRRSPTSAPRSRADWAEQVRADLLEAAGPAGPADAAAPALTVLVDPELAVDDVVAAIAAVTAVRHGSDDQPRFPDVRLGRSLEPLAVADARRPDVNAGDEMAQNAAMLLAIVGDDSDSDGTLMSDRAPGDDLSQQIRDVREGPASPAPGSVQDPSPDRRSAPTARVTVGEARAFDDSSLAPAAVASKVRSTYLAGIQRCYRTALAADPAVHGTLHLRLTVTGAGRVTGGEASGVQPALDACVTARLNSWRFPPPRDADDQPVDAAFELTVALRAD